MTTERARKPVAVARCRLAAALLAAAGLLVPLLTTAAACGSADIRDVAVGRWQEVGTAKPQVMVVSSDGQNAYKVAYRGSLAGAPWPGLIENDKLIVWSENEYHPDWTVIYDADSDQLTAVGWDGTYTLERLDSGE